MGMLRNTFGNLKSSIVGTTTSNIDAKLDLAVKDIISYKSNSNRNSYIELIKSLISKNANLDINTGGVGGGAGGRRRLAANRGWPVSLWFRGGFPIGPALPRFPRGEIPRGAGGPRVRTRPRCGFRLPGARCAAPPRPGGWNCAPPRISPRWIRNVWKPRSRPFSPC
jgi:hypothetical protein